ncbi:MAG: hypothetical protein Q9220_007441 [cf. Caloplaca sp. 1 TL-2023]
MSLPERSEQGLDAAANINAFLSLLRNNVKPYTSPSRGDEASHKVGELNLNSPQMNDFKVTSTATGIIPSPPSKPSDMLPTEKMSDWVQVNALLDHSKSKNPTIEALQAQESPRISGVRAPPSTPETVSNPAIGQMLMDELDRIPEDRLLSLGDSKYAPKNASLLNTARSTAASYSRDQFFSPVPRLTKPRDDQSFPRMSFQAASTPRVQPVSDRPLIVHGPPSSAGLKENNPLITRADAWLTRSTPANGKKGSEPNVSHSPPPTPMLKPQGLDEAGVSKAFAANSSRSRIDDEPDIQSKQKPAMPPPVSLVHSISTQNVHPEKKDGIVKGHSTIVKPGLDLCKADLTVDTSDAAGDPLTPSSMTFAAVSPTKLRAAGITTAIGTPKVVGSNLEDALYFKAWPKVEVRTVVLTGIPTSSTPTLISSFIYGGPLESIRLAPSTAFVTFLRAEDATKYYDDTANGLIYKDDHGIDFCIMTEKQQEADPVSGILREWMEKEFTRCVRVIGVDEDWTLKALHETASRKGRKVEKIVDGTNVNKMRSVTFRFCEITDAVRFKQTLNRSEEWEECNIHYAPDPCTEATGIHMD